MSYRREASPCFNAGVSRQIRCPISGSRRLQRRLQFDSTGLKGRHQGCSDLYLPVLVQTRQQIVRLRARLKSVRKSRNAALNA